MNQTKAGWKQKLVGDLTAYYINVAYLFLFLGMFTMYRRLILAHYQISYVRYGVSLIEALVLAKVIVIGEGLRLARGFEHKPLIVPTMYKAIVFSALVGAFSIVEHLVVGLFRGRGLAQSFDEMMGKNFYELLARCLVTFFAFIPFFAVRELARALGKGKIQELFFRSKAAT